MGSEISLCQMAQKAETVPQTRCLIQDWVFRMGSPHDLYI